MEHATEDLIYEVKGGIGWITFNRPKARNAFTFAMYEGVAEICRDAGKGEAVSAIVMCGAGDKAFAAGTDIGQFKDFSTAEDAFAYEENGNRMMADIERCPVPTIAAIHGACTGGGAAVAASCDIRLTAADLKFGFPIARTLGNCLSNENLRRLSWLVGPARVSEMLLTARLVGAEEAKAIGLVSEVLPDRDAVMARATELSETLKGHAPITMRVTKEALRRLRTSGAVPEDRDLIEAAYTSADFREGMSAFLEKRRPTWQNR
ncbi:enoyl-CoA hydratase/isomerase family protein [Nisaea nitritireducens]|uniref:enoyl-CoA hydratase/isomerase family protein n=1 Tax=Nisaea nitritireducens TaxID=568392 RepID=UPI0018690A12|nr:enoyl-CoA hydratase/isomerase family protein [Nisaea nitritireducens]